MCSRKLFSFPISLSFSFPSFSSFSLYFSILLYFLMAAAAFPLSFTPCLGPHSKALIPSSSPLLFLQNQEKKWIKTPSNTLSSLASLDGSHSLWIFNMDGREQVGSSGWMELKVKLRSKSDA